MKPGHNNSALITDEGLDLGEHRRQCAKSRTSTNRVFKRHKETTLHKESLKLEANKHQLEDY